MNGRFGLLVLSVTCAVVHTLSSISKQFRVVAVVVLGTGRRGSKGIPVLE